MVAAELRLIPYVDAEMTMVLRNYGPTVARDVEVRFDPELGDPPAGEAHRSVVPYLKRRYARPIPVMTPGMELDNLWFIGDYQGDRMINTEPVPDRVMAHVSYSGADGKRYDDEFVLDVDVLRGRTYGTSSAQPDQIAKQALAVLKKIEAKLPRS